MSDDPSDSVGPEEPAPPLPAGLGGSSPVTVLWRPGCPFCALLLRGLDRAGLAHDRIDIWAHPEAAAWVRTVAAGDETVPTVRVGGRGPGDPFAVALVNPSTRTVLEAVARVAPHGLPRVPAAGVAGGGGRGLLRRLRSRRAR